MFLGRLFLYPWMPIVLWTVFGGFIRTLLGLVAGFGLPAENPPTTSYEKVKPHRTRI